MFVDSHAHIDGVEYEADRLEVIQRARDAGVHTILNVISGDLHSGAFERAVELAEKFAEIYAALGVHPHDAKLFDDNIEERIRTLVKSSNRVIAWGEIGLDYHYDNSPREVQRDAFRLQLRLARELNLPVIIHTREAETDTIEILREEWTGTDRRGIMHCFSGSAMLAQATIELGFLISFAGVLTFKKAEDLRAVAADVPLDRLLIETDCPFLTPVPFRGRRNEPALVVEVARSLAAIHGKTLEEIAAITSANFAGLFPMTRR
ncbi:MAG TPA: TatD family hydrolase [Pyrinomonadaceae bacterium]|jgi:TatD DNase family protein|nr:TatD family hydrolase [Pyrinomonadaceae bacterium]